MKNVEILLLIIVFCSCSSYQRFNRNEKGAVSERVEPSASGGAFQTGMASYYAHEFHGRKTANGEVYDMHAMTAAHRTLAFNTRVRVENMDNGRAAVVRVNDRGPFAKGRIIDLSLAAAKEIGMTGAGTARVRLIIVE